VTTSRLKGCFKLGVGCVAWPLAFIIASVAAGCDSINSDPNTPQWRLEQGWITNCAGAEFKVFTHDGAAGPGPDRPVFRISDQLVLAVPREYTPSSQSIEREPRTCTKINDLPVVRFLYFDFQGKWSKGYKPNDVPVGFSGQRVQPDRVMVRIQRDPPRNLSPEQRKEGEENRRKVEQLWGTPRETAGLTCSVYCWKGNPFRDPDFKQLKYQNLNSSFIQIYADYWSPKYGGTTMSWEVVTSDLSHWSAIDDEVWKRVAEWNLLKEDHPNASQAGQAQ